MKFNPDIFPGLLFGLSGVTVILGVLKIDVELLLPLIGDGTLRFCGNVFDFSFAGDKSFGESGIKDKLEFCIEFLDAILFPIFDVELFSLLLEIDPPIGEKILSYRGSHDVVHRNRGLVGLIELLSATRRGLIKSRWPILVSASLELTVDDSGRRRIGLKRLTSLSLSVYDESPSRDGIRNRLCGRIYLLGFSEISS